MFITDIFDQKRAKSILEPSLTLFITKIVPIHIFNENIIFDVIDVHEFSTFINRFSTVKGLRNLASHHFYRLIFIMITLYLKFKASFSLHHFSIGRFVVFKSFHVQEIASDIAETVSYYEIKEKRNEDCGQHTSQSEKHVVSNLSHYQKRKEKQAADNNWHMIRR